MLEIELESTPSFGMAVVTLGPREVLTAESGSMVAMHGDVEVSSGLKGTGDGGLVDLLVAAITAFVRRLLVSESMFVNRFTARQGGDTVMLAPALVGDVRHERLQGGRRLTIQASSYLASSAGVAVDMVWAGFRMLFSGEGAFFMECHGEGDLLINAYGAIEPVEVQGAYAVDCGHVVAFEGDLTWTIRRASSSWFSTFASGEGLVLEFQGTGRVWLQTRNLGALTTWLRPHLG